MGKKLSESLSQFISSSPNSFDDPYKESASKKAVNLSEFIEHTDEARKSRKKKNGGKKDTGDDDISEIIHEISEKYTAEDDIIDDFEGYIEDYLLGDEDEEFRKNLIRYGRKYARDTRQSEGNSEIQKAYADAEISLNRLIKEVADDKDALQKDITQMRTSRSRNYKAFADLIEAKTSMHSTQLNAIKEMNAITKNKFELQMKADKTKQEDANDNTMANKMIQGLFGVGRSNLIGSYEEVSGAIDENYDSVEDDDATFAQEVALEEKRLREGNRVETDGDKFLRYEGIFSHYVLEYNDDGPIRIFAEDIDGNEIPDYPISNMSELKFTISENTGTATDNLSQQYQLRKV